MGRHREQSYGERLVGMLIYRENMQTNADPHQLVFLIEWRRASAQISTWQSEETVAAERPLGW